MGNACEACEQPTAPRETLKTQDDAPPAVPVDSNESKP
jgi:hypothetical protein